MPAAPTPIARLSASINETARPILLTAIESTSLALFVRVTVPAVAVTMKLVAVMAADCVMLPAAESVTVLPEMPAAAMSKPLASV